MATSRPARSTVTGAQLVGRICREPHAERDLNLHSSSPGCRVGDPLISASVPRGLAGRSDRPIFFDSSSLLLESESAVVDENCHVDLRIPCLVGEDLMLDQEIFLVETRKRAVESRKGAVETRKRIPDPRSSLVE
jgi:hypothetical protein